jgi:hypothetical protein
MTIYRELALNTTNEHAQNALARNPLARPHLLLNEHLHDDVWTALWNSSSPEDKITLTSIPLPAHRLEEALATPRLGAYPLASILRHQELTDTQTANMLTRRMPASAVTGWLASGRYTAHAEEAILERVNPGARDLWRLVSPHLFDQDRMLELLDQAVDPKQRRQYALELQRHPNAGTGVITAALAANPPGGDRDRRRHDLNYAITRPWNQADTPAELELLRTLAGWKLPHVTWQRYATRARELGWPDTSSRTGHGDWTAINPSKRNKHIEHLRGLNRHGGTQLTMKVARQLEHLLRDANPATWETAVSLLTGAWEGTISELAAAAGALAAPHTPHTPSTPHAEPAAAPPPARTTRQVRPPAAGRSQHAPGREQ